MYARVAPEQKLKIVQALQDRGEFVAMTGDGVNDAPALAPRPTSASRWASPAPMWPRRPRRWCFWTTTSPRSWAPSAKAAASSTTSASSSSTRWPRTPARSGRSCSPRWSGLPIPLLPIHILWINLVTDGLPGLALGSEPHEKGIMSRPPRAPKESIFADGLGIHMIWVGLLMGAASLFTQAAHRARSGHWQTMVFTVLCFSPDGPRACRPLGPGVALQPGPAIQHGDDRRGAPHVRDAAGNHLRPGLPGQVFKTQPLTPVELTRRARACRASCSAQSRSRSSSSAAEMLGRWPWLARAPSPRPVARFARPCRRPGSRALGWRRRAHPRRSPQR